nr:EAL domain-containing protein [uncultured Rhodoferax sp.]
MAKILVVDDQAENRLLVVTLIDSLGHQALEASDGVEALALVRSEHPDLVISDILMPTMDGYEFVRQLREDAALAATEVIFYSAHYREREARNLAKACGVSHVLIKPCEPQDILLAINQALAHVAQPPTAPNAQVFSSQHLRLMTNTLSEKVLELEAVNRRMAALTDLNLQLASEQSPSVLLEKVCRGARDLIGAQYAVVCANGKSDGALVFATSGIDATRAAQLESPALDRGPLGQARAERRACRITNTQGDATAAGLPSDYPAMHCALIAPVVSLSKAYGWILLANKLGESEFSLEDEQILSILAAQVGRIYENGTLYNEVRQHAELLQLEMAERVRATDALRESERRFSDMLDNVELVSLMLDRHGRITYCNDYLLRLTGWGRDELLGRDWFTLFVVPEPARVKVTFLELLAKGKSTGHLENEILIRNGRRRLIRWSNTILYSAAGDVTGTASIGEDITDYKEAENKIRRLNRVYAVLSGINTLIVHVRNRDDLFRESCQIAVKHGLFRTAWIGIVDPGAMEIRPVALAGADAAFMDVLKDRLSLGGDTAAERSMSVRAVQEKRAILSNDLRTEPTLISAKDRIERGILSMAFLPLLVQDTAVGVLALYADEAVFFDAEEMTLLNELAGDIGFALDHLDKEERLNYLAYYDEITGLPNRTLFLERVGQLLRVRNAEKSSTALALVDIDRFRLINDTLDRRAGDELLKLVAQRIQQSQVGFDTVARVGINCFGIAQHDPRDAGSVARSLEQLLIECFAKPFQLRGTDLRIAGKVGIALHPADGDEAETLFRNAEAALKRAKGSAESLMFYAPAMNTRVTETLNLESRLRTALDLNQFVLYYQPKVDLSSRRLSGVEALIRWNDPESGLIAPAQFIPILEETGLIYDVGRWALRQAREDSLRWRMAGLTPVRVAVNVSPLQLRHGGFVNEVRKVIGSDPLAAMDLELEITESVIMEDVNHSIDSLREIRAMGITIAIDDFGTGFSSLGYLAKLPVDTLKIDRSFVIDMTVGPQGLALVSTIISLAHALKLKVVAEGVETEEQARLLRLLNCDDMQGYLFSKPLPREALESLHLTRSAAACN